jgi:ABC-2 type transport system ATP-binding protein
MLQIHDLRKSYGNVQALNGVSLTLEPGEIVGLLGPNGAGKTTLVSIICGLRRADGGAVQVNGINALAHPQRARRHIGVAPQDTGVYPVVSVRRNLRLFGELTGLRGSQLADQIDEVAEALQITNLLDRKAGTLSGGQKRRLHTAIALLGRPPLLLLDEATTGTDVDTRKHLLQVIRGLAARGSAILYSTHYLGEVEELDASVVIIERGAVIAEGPVQELVARNGAAVLELTFDGSPPQLDGDYEVKADGSVLRVMVDNPGRSMALVLASLGPEASRLRSVEIIRPSLETVYLALTGRRFEAGEEIDVSAS